MLKMRSADPAQTTDESVEAVRRRAQYRLVGTVVLVVVGVVGFPLVFDTQPRPVSDDLPIIIPDKTQVPPLQVSPEGVAPAAPSAEAAGGSQLASNVPSQMDPSPQDSLKSAPQKSEPSKALPPQPEPARPQPVKPEPVKPSPVKAPVQSEPVQTAPAKRPTEVAPPKADAEGARARAILEGKPAAAQAPESATRVVVQVGSYSDQASVTRVRRVLESAGLKTYTQVVNTTKGKLTRVRVGPFDSAAQAEKVSAQVKKLGLDSSIVKL
jgi:DedD protein